MNLGAKEKLMLLRLWLVNALVIIIVYWIEGIISAFIVGAIIFLLFCVVYDAMMQFPPIWSKRIILGCAVCIIPFGVIGASTVGKWIPWPDASFDLRSYILDTKIAKAKASRIAMEEQEKKQEAEEAQKELTLTVTNAANNIANISDKLDDLQKSTDERFEYAEGRMNALAKGITENRRKIDGLSAPPPSTETVVPLTESETILPPLPELTEPEKLPEVIVIPEFKWVPVLRRTVPKKSLPAIPYPQEEPKQEAPLPPKVIPKPEEIRPAEPQPRIEHRTKVAEPPQKQLVAKCNCGKSHLVLGFWKYPDGTSVPDYAHCTDDFGRPCVPQSYEHAVVQK